MAEAQANCAVVHVDLDAFYAQVEQHRDPERLLGKPTAVMQYNPFGDLKSLQPDDDRIMQDSNGSLIAVSYEARAHGVKRGAMRGDEARKVCPELQLVQVPTAHGKADLTLYRNSGKKVMDILAQIGVCEKASIDECYLDLSQEARKRLAAAGGLPPAPASFDCVHVCAETGPVQDAEAWWGRGDSEWGQGERVLATAAAIMVELRATVRSVLGYTCSAGIAHNKILAKLASGMHKPAAQTLIPLAGVPLLLRDLPISKLRQLGGKFGNSVMAKLGISTVGELATISLARLDTLFGEQSARWLHNLARGFDGDEVKQRTLPKSLSCGKTFLGPHTLRTLPAVLKWLQELAGELEERISADRGENNREPRLLTAQFAGVSRSCGLQKCDAHSIAHAAHELVKRWAANEHNWGIESLFLAASSFAAIPTGSSITRFLKATSKATAPTPSNNSSRRDSVPPDRSATQRYSTHRTASTVTPDVGELGLGSTKQDSGTVDLEDEACTLQLSRSHKSQPGRSQTEAPLHPAACKQGDTTASQCEAGASCGGEVGAEAWGGDHEHRDHENVAHRGSQDARGPEVAGRGPSSCSDSSGNRQGLSLGWEGGEVDEDVLMALPPDLKHEVRCAVLRHNHMRGRQAAGQAAAVQQQGSAQQNTQSERRRVGRGGIGIGVAGQARQGAGRGIKRPAASSITQFFQKQK